MNKEQFIKERVKILVSKQGYSKAKATAVANAQYNKEQQPAQQGKMFNQQIPQQNFTIPNLNQLPSQEYDFNYNSFNPQPIQNNTTFGQPSNFSNYSIPQQPTQPVQSFQNYNQAQNKQEVYNNSHNPNDYMRGDANLDGSVNSGDKAKEVYTTNSVNIVNPNEGFGDPMHNLNRGLYNIGKGNTGIGIAGLGAFALGAARNGLLGYSTGKEDRRIEQEYNDKRFDRTPNYYAQQQGGQIENKMYQTGNSNVNAEDGEIVLQDGQIAEVDGKRHLNQKGKNIGGTDIKVKEGAKIVSDADMPTQKITDRDKTIIDDMYGIKVKKGITHADAVRELLKPLSIKKENNQLEDLAEKLRKANKIKDRDTKDLSILALQKEYSKIKEKVDTIEQERAERTNFVFENIQEPKPKQGDGTQLFDKNGKVVEERSENIAQQGLKYQTKDQSHSAQNVAKILNANTYNDGIGINLKKIKSIQSGVSNGKLGDGYYIYYDKLPTEQGFDTNKNREFVTQEAYTNIVLKAPAYQEYMKSFQQPKTQQIASMQQGGGFESIAQKYGISAERANELISMQSGGMIKRADGSYSKRGLWDNIRANRGSGKSPTKEMLEQERKIKNRQQGGEESIEEDLGYMIEEGMELDDIVEQLMKLGYSEEQISEVVEEVEQDNTEEQENPNMQQGGIPERYKNMGFSRVGQKKNSTRDGKKWMVLAKKGNDYKVVHGGADGMQDYSQHGSEERKKRFWDRMGGKNSSKATDPFSPLYWHKRLGKWQEGGEAPQDPTMQIMQAVAEMMQEGMDEQQITEQLVQGGIPEEQAGQLIQAVVQQMQAQAEPQGEAPQEEQMMAQQGGQKMYAQSGYNFSTKLTPNIEGFDVTGKSVINKDELKDVEDWQSFREGLGYGKQVAGVKDFTGVHSWYFDTPEKIEAFKKAVVKKGKQPEVEAFQKAYNQEIEKRGKSAGLSDENIKSALDKVGFSKTGVQKEDGLFGAFTSTRPLYSFSKKDGVIETKVDATPTQQQDDAERVETRNNVKNYLANFPSYMPPQFAMQSYAKESYNPALDYAKKMSVEPFSQQMASKYGMEEAKLEQSGLSPQQLAGMRGNMFSSMLGAENDMNFKVSEYNANDQQKVDFANTQAMNRAQIMNSQYNQDYQNKVMQTIAANEESQKNDYRTNFMQNQVNSNKVIDINTANALNNNFAITPNGVVPLDNKPFMFTNNNLELLKNYDKMTPAERIAFVKSQSKLS